ncbi:MAG TPA: GNAT family N-acetyltransferase [Pseudomonadales bacterium]|nr:GNAT family N-acetyltransferase [Pseudomonadales bacterium]
MDAIDPLLLDLPSEWLTPRLRLTPPAPGDGVALNRAIAESFPELHEWMDWAIAMPSPIDSERFVRDAAARFQRRDDLPLFMWTRDTHEFVGSTGMHRIDWKVPRVEIGYWCRTNCVGRGYVSEAVAELVRFAFGTLRAARIEIRTDALNARSYRIAERLGFTLDATFRRDTRTAHGTLRDTRVYSMIDPAALRAP